jgi:hypothetical protein
MSPEQAAANNLSASAFRSAMVNTGEAGGESIAVVGHVVYDLSGELGGVVRVGDGVSAVVYAHDLKGELGGEERNGEIGERVGEGGGLQFAFVFWKSGMMIGRRGWVLGSHTMCSSGCIGEGKSDCQMPPLGCLSQLCWISWNVIGVSLPSSQ